MPYVVVSGLPVFLSDDRIARLRCLWVQERRPKSEVLASAIASIRGTPESRDFEAFRRVALERFHRDDPKTFEEEWVNFDLQGPTVDQEAYYVIGDSCALYQRGGIIPMRQDFTTTPLEEIAEEAEFFPAGKTFLLGFESKHYMSLRRPSTWRKSSNVLLTVRTAGIYRIIGTLLDFYVYSTDFMLKLGPTVEVLPSELRPPGSEL